MLRQSLARGLGAWSGDGSLELELMANAGWVGPSMSRRLSWRDAGDTCATTAGVAEAAALWRVELQVPSRSSLLKSAETRE